MSFPAALMKPRITHRLVTDGKALNPVVEIATFDRQAFWDSSIPSWEGIEGKWLVQVLPEQICELKSFSMSNRRGVWV
ncbi:unnamed protein product [Danaus chrysippus]|uniref:(African queen) hypothetical protein n=1 Tax=Danaus chrysippus TaxID=151541 RepID=A0A8J2QUJ9_9NEOP|nr:unnamed protein product [Danaus chrysippus]